VEGEVDELVPHRQVTEVRQQATVSCAVVTLAQRGSLLWLLVPGNPWG